MVKVDGKAVGQSDAVRAGQTIEFALPETKPAELKPVEIPLDVIFEDKHLVVLNKPAGMVVHPGSGTGELAGIRGEAQIEIAPDGAHTLHLDYEL